MRTRARPLNEGEIELASLLFRDAIDYRRVRIHARRYMPFQPKNCCMTPNGSMYFHHSCFLDDYSYGPALVHARDGALVAVCTPACD
jgi:hypothetical protein